MAAEAEQQSLASELAILRTDQAAILREANAAGQVKFMKSFMRKVPGFDWSQLGQATTDYAEELKQEMAEEDAAKEAEAAKKRAEEEARFHESQDPPADQQPS